MIEQLDDQGVKSKYHQIISDANSIIRRYNQGLKTRFENFRKKIENHKAPLETNIRQYIERINEGLNSQRSCVQKFIISIKNIESEITKFKSNYTQIHKSNDYIIPTKLMKFSGGYPQKLGLKSEEISKIYKIAETLVGYINASNSFDRNKTRFSTIMFQLKHYSDQFVNKTVNYEENKSGSNIVDPVLNPLQGFKAHVDKFIRNIHLVQKLEEIGKHIRHMKQLLPKVKGEVKDEAKTYIEGLAEIKIKHEDVKSRIEEITRMNNVIIGKLQIAKQAIEFKQKLKDEISKLKEINDVKFEKYDTDEFLTNSNTLKENLGSFEKYINPKHSTVMEQVKKFKEQNHEGITPAATCKDKTLDQQDDDLISPVLASIGISLQDIPKIISFIDYSSKKVKMIEHILLVLQQILELECAIEGVPMNLILCTINRVSSNLINHHNLGVVEVDRPVINIYSMINVMDYRVLVNRLYDSAKKIDQILRINNCPDVCKCILGLESTKKIQLQINFKKIIEQITSDNKSNDLKIDDIKNLHNGDIKENHFCLCMIIKYILYPKIVNISHRILGIDLDTLSTLSRKFDKYHNSSSIVPKMLLIMVEILDTISQWIIKNYPYACTGYMLRVEIECYCKYNEDRNYQKIVGILLVMSSMIENVWTIDPQSTRMAIQTLSSLITEFDKIDSQNKSICNNNVYWLLVDKECKPESKSPDKCCCWCPSVANVLVMCIYLSFQCKLCNALCAKQQNGCKKVENFCKVEECTCKCTDPKNGVCCLLKLALSSELTCSEELQKALQQCCNACQTQDNCCCKKLADKASKGLCKLLLLGCECDCATKCPSEEVKVKCVFFNDLDGSPRVAVLVYCKCKDDKGCCLTTIIENFKSKLSEGLKKICEENNCLCDELKKGCDDLCCPNGSCDNSGCPCKDLKEKLEKICKGNGNCGGECLCKQIDEIIKKCKDAECKCKDKDGCCKCPCCKMVTQIIILLTRACKANVLEPYKRILTDLVASDKNKKELMVLIVKGINQTRLNNIYLIKNNHLTSHNNEILNTKYSIESRNWGYETLYEHQVTTPISFSDRYNLLGYYYKMYYNLY